MVELSAYPPSICALVLMHFCGVTPRLLDSLLRRFGTLEAIFQTEAADFLQIEGLGREVSERLDRAPEYLAAAADLAESLGQRDISLISRFDDDYGQLLFELHNPPALLYLRGRIPDRTRKSIAVVGTTAATSEGIALTSALVKELVSQDVQIISSLAGGIDSAAHLAARAAGGSSFAVIDCGIDQIDERQGIPLAIDIVQKGGILSEYAPEQTAGKRSAGEANRLVIGLAQAVVVTELYSDSGRTLDVLRACREIGKLAFVMIDPQYGALADKASLSEAAAFGAVLIEGLNKTGDIVRSLV